ncbi:hypothetical protein H696_04017 [Fonticula alba]|uniref:Uncharacterized protein n=1 Tax=Fonticula alba TaxID=691883 RepID=A0A058Z7U9_FONAL|nr:hypothetical protein H696_04017 [Fonticula alba]KCV69597.1 hypothetical protein H696_04017 [Fonticula alba]|eukprot:XP_009496162.1 hypothetical protein H696_04017 [Fonticula alba]
MTHLLGHTTEPYRTYAPGAWPQSFHTPGPDKRPAPSTSVSGPSDTAAPLPAAVEALMSEHVLSRSASVVYVVPLRTAQPSPSVEQHFAPGPTSMDSPPLARLRLAPAATSHQGSFTSTVLRLRDFLGADGAPADEAFRDWLASSAAAGTLSALSEGPFLLQAESPVVHDAAGIAQDTASPHLREAVAGYFSFAVVRGFVYVFLDRAAYHRAGLVGVPVAPGDSHYVYSGSLANQSTIRELAAACRRTLNHILPASEHNVIRISASSASTQGAPATMERFLTPIEPTSNVGIFTHDDLYRVADGAFAYSPVTAPAWPALDNETPLSPADISDLVEWLGVVAIGGLKPPPVTDSMMTYISTYEPGVSAFMTNCLVVSHTLPHGPLATGAIRSLVGEVQSNLLALQEAALDQTAGGGNVPAPAPAPASAPEQLANVHPAKRGRFGHLFKSRTAAAEPQADAPPLAAAVPTASGGGPRAWAAISVQGYASVPGMCTWLRGAGDRNVERGGPAGTRHLRPAGPLLAKAPVLASQSSGYTLMVALGGEGATDFKYIQERH